LGDDAKRQLRDRSKSLGGIFTGISHSVLFAQGFNSLDQRFKLIEKQRMCKDAPIADHQCSGGGSGSGLGLHRYLS